MYRLRELERRDIPEINRWRNDPDMVSGLGAPFRYIGSEVDDAWFDSYLKNRTSAVRCSIVGDDDRILGLVSLTSIDSVHRSAELHIMIGDSRNRGCGMGTFAVTEMLCHGFYNLNLNRIELGVLEDNIAARKLYEKVGFVAEGTKRNAKFKNGVFCNMIMYGMLREEYDRLSEERHG